MRGATTFHTRMPYRDAPSTTLLAPRRTLTREGRPHRSKPQRAPEQHDAYALERLRPRDALTGYSLSQSVEVFTRHNCRLLLPLLPTVTLASETSITGTSLRSPPYQGGLLSPAVIGNNDKLPASDEFPMNSPAVAVEKEPRPLLGPRLRMDVRRHTKGRLGSRRVR